MIGRFVRAGMDNSIRRDVAAVDSMLADIERFQARTNNLMLDIRQIDQGINNMNAAAEENKDKPLSKKALKK